jgi:hypothetical protein
MNLPRFGESWWRRWMYLRDGYSLHRVAAISWADLDRIDGWGATACGKFGELRAPGVLGRMGANRCRECCKEVGIPRGAGAPFNEGIDA